MLPKQEYLGLLIAVTRRRIKQAVLSRLAPFRISSQQFWVLLAVRTHPGDSFGDLAERQGLDAPTASRVIAGLRARKLVKLELHPVDRRRSRIELTRQGEALAGKVQPIADGVRAAIVAGLTTKEVEALKTSLRKVMEQLARFEEQKDQARPLPRRTSSARQRKRPSPSRRVSR